MSSDTNALSRGDLSAPTGPAVPSAREIESMGVIGLDIGKSGRVTVMNQIGAALGIPAGGWHGQAKLYDGGDIRLRWLLARFANGRQAKLIASNVGRAGRYVHVNLMLAVVCAAREFDRSLTATGTVMINTYHEGGLDFLDQQKARLGLPRKVTGTWAPASPLRNIESGHMVYPERIPAHDQLLAYAAQIAASFAQNFEHNLRQEFGEQAAAALATASRPALLVWQAYAFLAPGGSPYDAKKELRGQLGQHFGHRSALGYYAQKANDEEREPSLDEILTDHSLDHLEWLHSAKTRAAEALFVERLLKRVRDVIR
jgi:hypothetical protein